MRHTYQRTPGDGDSNRPCECDRNYNHDTSPNWERSEALAEVEIARIHADAPTGPLSEPDRQLVLAEVARVQNAEPHLNRLIGLLLHIAADLDMPEEES